MIGKIYALKDPITEQIRYIGQTRISIEERASHHWRDREQEKNKNNHKANWISKLYKDHGVKPIVILIENITDCTNSLLNEKEKHWIKYYRDLGFDLTNTSGKDYFHVHKKIVDSNTSKILFCYDRNYILQIFKSGREASRVLNINYKQISANANGKFVRSPFVFSFKELKEEEIDCKFVPKKLSYVQVKSIDKTTKEERIFKNQQEGAKYFNCNFRNINFVLKGIRKSCANQYWEYIK